MPHVILPVVLPGVCREIPQSSCRRRHHRYCSGFILKTTLSLDHICDELPVDAPGRNSGYLKNVLRRRRATTNNNVVDTSSAVYGFPELRFARRIKTRLWILSGSFPEMEGMGQTKSVKEESVNRRSSEMVFRGQFRWDERRLFFVLASTEW